MTYIKAVVVQSEKDLLLRMNEISVQIKDIVSYGWKERIEAMHCLVAFANGGATNYGGFLTALKAMQDGLAAQTQDLRSSVAREVFI